MITKQVSTSCSHSLFILCHIYLVCIYNICCPPLRCIFGLGRQNFKCASDCLRVLDWTCLYVTEIGYSTNYELFVTLTARYGPVSILFFYINFVCYVYFWFDTPSKHLINCGCLCLSSNFRTPLFSSATNCTYKRLYLEEQHIFRLLVCT